MSLARTLALAALAAPAAATLSISNVFGSTMVFQRDKPFPVWGWADAGAAVRGTLGADAASATADAAGLYRLTFNAVAATGVELTLVVSAPATRESVTLDRLLAGDVFFCSGQSNMEYTTNVVANASIALAEANSYPFIRVTSGPLQGKLDLRNLLPTPYNERVAVDLPW